MCDNGVNNGSCSMHGPIESIRISHRSVSLSPAEVVRNVWEPHGFRISGTLRP